MVITSMSWDITPIIIGIQPLFFLELQPQELLHMSSGAKFLSRAHIASYIIQDVQNCLSSWSQSFPAFLHPGHLVLGECICIIAITRVTLESLGYCWLKGTIWSCIFMKWFTYMFYILHHFTCSTPPKKTCPPVNRNIPAECLVGDGGSDLAKKRPKKIIERAEHLNQSLGSKWSKLQEWNMIKD